MAAAIVLNFFERLTDGWSYDAADLKNLWTGLRKDPTAAGGQLARCLLLHISAVEKYEGDKAVPSCFQAWASQMSLDPERKAWAEDILGKLLQKLAEWIPHGAKQSRVRVLELLVAILRGLPREAELDSSVTEVLVQHLRNHLPDKDDRVRELVVVALTKLAVVEEDENVRDNVIFEELIEALHSDISQNVRTAVVMRLGLDDSTLDDVLRHCTDRAAKVAAAVYDRVAQSVALAQPPSQGGVVASQQQRQSLLWYGLHEPRKEVRKAAQGLLGKWFEEDAAGDVVTLMEAFGPQANADVCRMVLEQLVALQKWDPQAWLQAAAASSRSPKALVLAAEQQHQQQEQQHQQQQQQNSVGLGGSSCASSSGASWLAVLTPELAFVWAHACRKVEELAAGKGRAAAEKVAAVVAQAEASAGAQAEGVLDSFLPTAQQLAKLCLLAAEAGPPFRYATAQLMDIATLPFMNWVDACSREAAEDTVRCLITRVARSDELHATTCHDAAAAAGAGCGYLVPASCGGSGAWEGAVLRFAAAVFGDGADVVAGVLPLVLRLAQEVGVAGERPEDAAEGPILQVLTYLHLLMTVAGSGVQPTASASLPAEAGSGSGGPAGSTSLVHAVDQFAWTTSGHPSPVVRAAAVRCRVLLCLRDGGSTQLPRTVAMLAPMLPPAQRGDGGGGGAAPSSSAVGAGAGDDSDREFAARQQLPRRAALQGLIDLVLTWGEPTLTAELAAAAVAAASRRRVEAVTAQLADMGMEVDGGGGAAQEGVEAQAPQGVVPILLRMTEGVVRKLLGSDAHTAARGLVADALLGMSHLLYTWSFQCRVHTRLCHQVVTAMKPHHAEQLLARLLLARFSPSLESEVGLRSRLSTFFKAFQEAASLRGDDGALHRRLLAGAFLHAARCAMALPAPPGAPTTARGCAAPALMEFAASVLASAAATAGSAEAEDDDDVSGREADTADTGAAVAGGGGGGGAASDPCAWLCELVLEEVVRVASPGNGSLDTSEPRVKAYVTELCKTPLRLLPGLSVASASAEVLATVRRLAYLGRRAALAAEVDLVGVVVPDTAYKKLQEFVRSMEKLQQHHTAPLTDADAAPFLRALLAQLQSLPSLEDVHAGLEAGEEWGLASDVNPGAAAEDQAGAGQRSGPGRGKGSTTSGRGGRGRRPGGKAATSRSTARPQRSDTRNAADDDEGDGDEGQESGTGSDDDDGRAARAAAKGSRAAARGGRARASGKAAAARSSASQDSTASLSASQGERRSSRAAAAKAAANLEAMKAKAAAAARMIL